MLDYTEVLRWTSRDRFAIEPRPGVILGIIRKDQKNTWIDAPTDTAVLYVMKDGLVLAEYARQDGDKLYSNKPGQWTIKTWHHPWNTVKMVKFRDYAVDLLTQPDGAAQPMMWSPRLRDCRYLKKQWDIFRETGDIPSNIPMIDESSPDEKEAPTKEKKSAGSVVGQWVMLFLLLGIGGFLWKYLLDGNPDICSARSKYFAEQVPGALDIVSRDHPMFGVLRSTLNDQNKLDNLVSTLAQEMGQNVHEDDFACFKEDVYMRFDNDDVRSRIAAVIEKELGL